MTFQRNATLISKVAIVVFATVIVFFQDLSIVANDALHTEFMSHIIAIPFLFSYLIFRKRKMLGGNPIRNVKSAKTDKTIHRIHSLHNQRQTPRTTETICSF